MLYLKRQGTGSFGNFRATLSNIPSVCLSNPYQAFLALRGRLCLFRTSPAP